MKILKFLFCLFCASVCALVVPVSNTCFAAWSPKYFTVYDENNKVLFLRGDEVSVGDSYLSGDNKLYEIQSVDGSSKTAKAKFISDEQMPEFKVKAKKSLSKKASAAVTKKVGVYHTHNDESYFTPDGIDSVYGKGGIHDVGKKFTQNLNKLGIETIYREDL